jgi:preprotein translocase subunit YajC
MQDSSNNYSLFLIIAVFVAFMFFSSRRRKKQAGNLAESVKVGANAVMLGGITGKIVSINNDSVVVETTPGVKIEFMKAAVRSVTSPVAESAPAVSVVKTPTKKTPAVKSVATKKTAK